MYTTLVVTDSGTELSEVDLKVIPFEQYLADYPKLGEPRTRIINLCDTERYLSRGYYCSLLAESRKHQALPSVNTINDLRQLEDAEELRLLWSSLAPLVPKDVKTKRRLFIYFGQVEEAEWLVFGRAVFDRFPAPALKVVMPDNQHGFSVENLSPGELPKSEHKLFYERLKNFTEKIWRSPKRRQYRWDMAILYDSKEEMGPSDAEAIQRFIRAAGKVGIEAGTIRSCDAVNLAQYDALFIRETTSIDHPSYRLARRAEKEGLVVIDDPTSIMRCCNKIFLHDAFSYNKVHAPHTLVIADAGKTTLERIESQMAYPMVLKMPESSFSAGVFKVKDRADLVVKLESMLETSSLALVQEYLYTDYDWRIGVLNGRAIYACKYFMARGHWQIYNHSSKQPRHQSGGFETIATFEVPRAVLKAALKACSIIGNGLYGVDIKEQDKQVYVIEVNDNPSIEHRIEDRYLGDELYMMIMQEFADRLEQRGRN
ncbi:carboxylate--amine ligase [Coraliomargarita sinensis]|uniref:Carboxylate--amine ligase n=1 Tax=Coraliomargarita sinensis TaxID=2174842 RepID=A0A317ZGS4_9BACT|nr:RimK family protein [Coraliomargarita sinensis]PXA04112.1 carboxylate--amine ligase [Coraliomargarita sinensis]